MLRFIVLNEIYTHLDIFYFNPILLHYSKNILISYRSFDSFKEVICIHNLSSSANISASHDWNIDIELLTNNRKLDVINVLTIGPQI